MAQKGLIGTWEQTEGVKGGCGAVTIHGSRRRHAARGSDTSDGGWRLVRANDVHVDGVLRQERRWGAVSIERFYDDKSYFCGDGRIESGGDIQKNERDRWVGRVRNKCAISDGA